MPSDEAVRLASSNRGYIIAPAGCGKTHTIAEAVSVTSSGRQLILTHTHAGVSALRSHLRKLGVSRERYNVETIAGWTLKYAASFPQTSDIPSLEPEDDQWEAVYLAAARLLANPAIAAVVRRSYAGVYVDEYQDCSVNQHQVVLALANLLPCRVVGDPLQAIFGFRDVPSISWANDVERQFQLVATLQKPWRWSGCNQELGEWLLVIREQLARNEPVDLSGAPVTFVRRAPQENQSEIAAAYAVQRNTGQSVVVVRRDARACHRLAARLGGAFGSMEEMDCRDLRRFAKRLDDATGAERALICVKHAKRCMTGVANRVTSLVATLGAGRLPTIRKSCPAPELYRAVQAVGQSQDWSAVRLLLKACHDLQGTRVYRRELWAESLRAVRVAEAGESSTLREAAWQSRSVTRQVGRREELRVVSRTLLVKGLEFDHAVVADVDSMDGKHLYVALTRGRHSLTVVADSPVLTPASETTADPDASEVEESA